MSLVACLSFLLSCTDRDLSPAGDEPDNRTRVEVNLEMTVHSGGISPHTRGAEADSDRGEYTLGTTEAECSVSRLTVFIVGLKETADGWEEDLGDVACQTLYVPTFTKEYKLGMKLKCTTGKKHIYVGGNMRQGHIDAFLRGEAYQATSGTAQDVVEELMTINMVAASEKIESGTDILMFTQATLSSPAAGDGSQTVAAEPEVIEVTSDGEVLQLDDARLERLVAKVLLTCKMDEKKPDEVVFQDTNEKNHAGSAADYHGWLELSDLYYMLNMTNRQTYMNRRPVTLEGKEYNEDPNFPIDGDIVYVENEKYYMVRDWAVHGDRFIHYVASEILVNDGDVSTLTGLPRPFTHNTLRQHPLAYDAGKLGATAAVTDHYTEGIYCLENTVKNREGNDWPVPEGDNYNPQYAIVDYVANLSTTYMLIAARYIPRKIRYVEAKEVEQGDGTTDVVPTDDNGDEIPLADAVLKTGSFSTKAEVEDLLKHPVRNVNEFFPNGYPAGTYWGLKTETEYEYYTLLGMQRRILLSEQEVKEGTATEPLTADDFDVYLGGYGYYTTYIDGEKDTQGGFIGYRDQPAWGLERNHYYILTVTEMVVPGSPTLNNVMRINSVTQEWTDRGGTEVIVRPGLNELPTDEP